MTAEDQTQAGGNPLGFLFGFKGGIGRGKFLAGLGVMAGVLVCLVAVLANFMDPRGGGGLFVPLSFVLVIVMAWIHAAIVVKRLRDAARPGWYYFVFGLGPFAWLILALEFAESFPFLVALVFLGLILAPVFFETKQPE